MLLILCVIATVAVTVEQEQNMTRALQEHVARRQDQTFADCCARERARRKAIQFATAEMFPIDQMC